MLNIKDIKILQELDLNPRITTSKLAKKVRLSQQVVDYRIKRLIEREVIISFGTILNLGKLNYAQYRVLFQLGNISEEAKKELINYLKIKEGVYWAAIVGGKWDLLITVFVKNYEELENFLDKLFTKYPNSLKDYDALYIISHEFYKHKYLENKISNSIKINFANQEKNITLDKIDLCLIKQIQSNCRLSSLEISKECKVSYKTVQNRIKNLENKGFIEGYRLFLKSEENKPYLLLISFSNYGRDEEKKILNYAQNNNLITQATKTFGKWNLIFHLRAKNSEEIQQLIIDLRNRYSIIGEYEIIPIFSDISINQFPIFS